MSCFYSLFRFTSVAERVSENTSVLNIAKTKCTVFLSLHKLVSNPQLSLSLGGNSVQEVKKTKLLGIVLDERLTWTEHIDKIVSKMRKYSERSDPSLSCVTPSVLSRHLVNKKKRSFMLNVRYRSGDRWSLLSTLCVQFVRIQLIDTEVKEQHY